MKNKLLSVVLSFIVILAFITAETSVFAGIYAGEGFDYLMFDESTGRIFFQGDSNIKLKCESSGIMADQVKEIDFSYDYNISINDAAFMYTKIRELHIPANVKFEPVYDEGTYGNIIQVRGSELTFANNEYLEKVSIACSSIEYTEFMFYDCSSITEISFVGEGENIEVIPMYFLFRALSLSNISIPKNVIEIRNRAFAGCDSLKNIYIPFAVKIIEDYALGYSLVDTYHIDEVYPDFTIYGHAGTQAQRYADDNLIPFIDVEELQSAPIIAEQVTQAPVGEETTITLSVSGHPDFIELESPSQKINFPKEDAEIVRDGLSETWTFDFTPVGENETYKITASYCGGDVVTTDEMTVTAIDVNPVNSVEVVTKGFVGETAEVKVNVDNSPETIRFVGSKGATTVAREKASITTENGKEEWTVSIPVTQTEETLSVFAKYGETGWAEQGTQFTLKAKMQEVAGDIKSFEIETGEENVIYQGVNRIKVKTSDSVSKVQLYQNGYTWTYNSDNAQVEEENGEKIWTIHMNFCNLGQQQFDIRTRTPKTTFTVTGKLSVLVYSK